MGRLKFALGPVFVRFICLAIASCLVECVGSTNACFLFLLFCSLNWTSIELMQLSKLSYIFSSENPQFRSLVCNGKNGSFIYFSPFRAAFHLEHVLFNALQTSSCFFLLCRKVSKKNQFRRIKCPQKVTKVSITNN